MTVETFKNVPLIAKNHNYTYEHITQLRSDFHILADIMTKKNSIKMLIQYFMHLKEFYDNLNQKLLRQFQLHKIVVDMKIEFDRVQIQMQQSNFEHTRILKDLVLNNLNDSLKQTASKIVCNVSKIRILIKLNDVENKINCRNQTCENIYFKINKAVRQNNILSIFFNRFYKESK